MMKPLRPDENRFNTVEEASRRLAISEEYMRLHLKAGNIRGVKVGKAWRISEEEMQRVFREGLTPIQIIPNSAANRRRLNGIIS